MAFFDEPVSAGTGIGAAVGGAAAKAVTALDAKAVEAVKTETGKLVEAAKSGGFRISEQGLAPLQSALDNMSGQLSDLMLSVDRISQAPRLGSHDYGQKVASHDQKSATSDMGSAAVVLRQFGVVLEQAQEALKRAAGKYRSNEEAQQSALNGG